MHIKKIAIVEIGSKGFDVTYKEWSEAIKDNGNDDDNNDNNNN